MRAFACDIAGRSESSKAVKKPTLAKSSNRRRFGGFGDPDKLDSSDIDGDDPDTWDVVDSDRTDPDAEDVDDEEEESDRTGHQLSYEPNWTSFSNILLTLHIHPVPCAVPRFEILSSHGPPRWVSERDVYGSNAAKRKHELFVRLECESQTGLMKLSWEEVEKVYQAAGLGRGERTEEERVSEGRKGRKMPKRMEKMGMVRAIIDNVSRAVGCGPFRGLVLRY